MIKRDSTVAKVLIVELDTREQQEGKRPEPKGKLEEVQVGNSKEKTTRISKNLPISIKLELIATLRKNSNLFARTAADMPGIDPRFICHRLLIILEVRPKAPKKRRISLERVVTI